VHSLIVFEDHSKCNGASMTRYRFLAVAFVAAACGSVKERTDCATSAGCPPGEYCAHTPEGSVCWPDAVSPTVTGVTVEPSTCPRDGQLTVTAEVEDDAELFAVEATADVDPAHAFPLTRQTGTTWSGTIALAQLDFPAFARETVVTVRALDGARNEVSAPAAQRPVVTRVRWERPLEAASIVTPTSPAVGADGTVVVGGSDGKLRFFLPGGEPAHPALALAGGAIAQPPSIGAQAIWVGANDGKLYGVKLDGSGELSPSRSCTASGVAKGPPAVLTTAGVDVAFGAFAGTQLVASSSTCALSPIRDGYSAGAAVDLNGNVIGVTTATGASTVRRFSWAGSAFEELWSAAVGATVTATPTFDADGRILTVGQDGGVDRTTAAGVTAPLATLSGSIDDSPIILSDGNLVVGDASGKLHRLTPDGTEVAGWPVDLGAAVHAPMALSGGPVRFLAATDDGRVHALANDGAVLWSGALTSGLALGAGNLHTPPGSAFSTAYFSGADGKLYAVVVEGGLDTTAPWPKAWHDPRNTSRAGGAF
jgi:hypothetical protein